MVEKHGLKLGGGCHPMSSSEKEVLRLLTKEFLTIKQASIHRGCSIQAIYKIRKSLIKKGFLNAKVPQEMQVEKNEGYIQPLNKIRLHAEQFVIGVLWRDNSYRNGVYVVVDGNTVKLNKRSVEVYSNTSFLGSSPAVCDHKALQYWYGFFNGLQERFKVILLKNGSLNVRRVRAEYAETNNELTKKLVEGSEYVRVFGDDGKQWLLFDNSHNLSEAETVHPVFARRDMGDVVQPFFNDLRDNPVLLSDIMGLLDKVVEQNYETASGLNVVVELLKPKNDGLKDVVLHRMWYHG